MAAIVLLLLSVVCHALLLDKIVKSDRITNSESENEKVREPLHSGAESGNSDSDEDSGIVKV